MAANTRIRIEPDIEAYLRSQSERVLGISPDKVSVADLTTLTNRVIYEHKLAQSMMRQEFIPRLFGWLKGVLPGVGGSNLVAISPQAQPESQENDDFDIGFVGQFDDAA